MYDMNTDFCMSDYDCVNSRIVDYRIEEDSIVIECMAGISTGELIFCGLKEFFLSTDMLGAKIEAVSRKALEDGYTDFHISVSESPILSFHVIAKEKKYVE